MAKAGTGKLYDKRITAVAIAIFAVSFVYWAFYSLNEYSTFHTYFDLAIFAYNAYFYIHYPAAAAGLQYLVFGNHISPDMLLLVMPFYALYQSPLTLLLVQDAVVSLAGLLIFFVVRNLTSRQWLALALSAAFFLNPGIHGILLFDFHTESFIPLFYILTFYYYMRARLWPFCASLVLLLSSLESVVTVALMLGIALLVYEYIHSKDAGKQTRIRLAYIIVFASIAAAALYYFTTLQLASAYANGGYPTLPNALEVTKGSQNNIVALIGLALPSNQNIFSYDSLLYLNAYRPFFIFGLLTIFLGFGISIFADIEIAVLAVLPYLAGVLLAHKSSFLFVYMQYFSFAIPGAVIAAILGSIILAERARGRPRTALGRLCIKASGLTVLTCAVASLLIFLASLHFVTNNNINNLTQDLLFQVGPSQRILDAQLGSVLSKIPPNASVMAEVFIMPHLTQRMALEDLVNNSENFAPQYIAIDFNLNVSLNAYRNQDFFYEYVSSNQYVLFAKNGTAEVYKKV